MRGAHAALVHWPVRDRAGDTVTTAVTTLDVHDLARAARTYGLAGLWIVSPVAAQREVVEAIFAHWREGGEGTRRVPERTEALGLAHVVPTVDDALDAITAVHGAPPRVFATSARASGRPVLAYDDARAIMDGAAPTLLLFGTGHGLADVLLARAEAVLPPIQPGGYNHLSVRAAFAITLDRLFAERAPASR